MKVLHVTANISAGAGNGVLLLHQALLNKGIDSSILCLTGEQDIENNIHVITNSVSRKIRQKIYTKAEQMDVLKYKHRSKELFSTGFYGFDLSKFEVYKKADIINFHWINHSMISLKYLSRIDKPLVWTFRDMWPLTGGCHHSFDCTRYSEDCGICPHLESKNKKDLSTKVLELKKTVYSEKTFEVVTISSWLRECAKRGAATKSLNSTVIHNGINIEQFVMLDKTSAKKQLSLPLNKKNILIGATDPFSKYKGWNKFAEALSFLKDKEEYIFTFFGNIDEEVVDKLGITYKSFGYINDIDTISSIYSAADLFLAPSVAEAFGKTLVEAMACGTPVVCFDGGGPKDIVVHMETGYKAEPFKPSSLAEGIEWVFSNGGEFGSKCRERVVKNFDINGSLVDKYINLYDNILPSENELDGVDS